MSKSKNKPNFLDNVIDKVTEHQREEQRRGCRFLVYFGAGLIALTIVMVIVGTIMTAIEESEVVSTYGEAIANLCNPMPSGTDSIDNAPQGEAPLGLLILIADTRQRHAWFQDVPALWRAESQEEVELVTCIKEEKTTLETCLYSRNSARGDESYTVKIDRIQYSATLVAINPTTGRRITSLTLTGTEPPPCPPDTPEVKSSTPIYGEKLSFKDMATWIESLVFGE